MNLHYTETGQGAPVLLLHGFMESQAVWTHFVKLLPTGFRYLLPDLPGFGQSTANASFTSVEAMATEVHTFLQTLQTGPVMVVAHSLGGYVALALAEAHPEVVNGLCPFHSTALPDSEEKKQTRDKTADFIERKGVAVFMETFVAPLFAKSRRSQMQPAIHYVTQIGLKTPQATAVGVVRAMRNRPDRRSVLEKAAFPVMFIVGRDDESVPLESSKEIFFLAPRSTVHVLPDTGHMGLFEHPQETAQLVGHWLSTVAK